MQTLDKNSFEKIFRELHVPLCRYAYTFLKDEAEAEETVQNVFVALWERRQDLQILTSMKSYLYQMVHNRCLNSLKHEKIKDTYKQYNQAQINQNPANASHLAIHNELSARIEEAIADLPEQCRRVFQMSRVDELKYSEIAEILSISIKTVENHMGKALKILREKLAEYLVALLMLFLNT